MCLNNFESRVYQISLCRPLSEELYCRLECFYLLNYQLRLDFSRNPFFRQAGRGLSNVFKCQARLAASDTVKTTSMTFAS